MNREKAYVFVHLLGGVTIGAPSVHCQILAGSNFQFKIVRVYDGVPIIRYTLKPNSLIVSDVWALITRSLQMDHLVWAHILNIIFGVVNAIYCVKTFNWAWVSIRIHVNRVKVSSNVRVHKDRFVIVLDLMHNDQLAGIDLVCRVSFWDSFLPSKFTIRWSEFFR